MKEDILTKIENDFAPDDAEIVRESLLDAIRQKPKLYNDRVLRCILFVSEGDLNKFEEAHKSAETDYRDLIVSAEYACGKHEMDDWKRSRNFEHPFGEECKDF